MSNAVRLYVKPAAVLTCLDRFRLYDRLYRRLQYNLKELFVSAVCWIDVLLYELGWFQRRGRLELGCQGLWECLMSSGGLLTKPGSDQEDKSSQISCIPLIFLCYCWEYWAWLSAVIGEYCHDNLDHAFKMIRKSLFSRTFPSLIITYIPSYWFLKSCSIYSIDLSWIYWSFS